MLRYDGTDAWSKVDGVHNSHVKLSVPSILRVSADAGPAADQHLRVVRTMQREGHPDVSPIDSMLAVILANRFAVSCSSAILSTRLVLRTAANNRGSWTCSRRRHSEVSQVDNHLVRRYEFVGCQVGEFRQSMLTFAALHSLAIPQQLRRREFAEVAKKIDVLKADTRRFATAAHGALEDNWHALRRRFVVVVVVVTVAGIAHVSFVVFF